MGMINLLRMTYPNLRIVRAKSGFAATMYWSISCVVDLFLSSAVGNTWLCPRCLAWLKLWLWMSYCAVVYVMWAWACKPAIPMRSRNTVYVGEPAEGPFVRAAVVCMVCRACAKCFVHWVFALGLCVGAHFAFAECMYCVDAICWFVELKYMVQQWVCWFKWRLRMHQIVICIVTCRSPWTNWLLNALCNFGKCLMWGVAHAFAVAAQLGGWALKHVTNTQSVMLNLSVNV